MKWTQFSGSFSFLRHWVLFRTGSYSGFPLDIYLKDKTSKLEVPDICNRIKFLDTYIQGCQTRGYKCAPTYSAPPLKSNMSMLVVQIN